ncbi:NAD(P)H-dependent oxidoreductase [Chitinophaga japonensis]|uniref:Kef-type potassium/proton antiporter accessory protein (CPA2 family) n=1 Tax=Chitinophaga japonensis TaxID=104662 RepID=A0A562TDS5_CHIJA|nr:NAD(P)H-dependent oxidoreductase [Chitinophaga japonensis]TWI91533.1 Kef-type potassium/proton antiporter accessory protein (CPA2 family) [Chitinophaga japonensis]
MTRILILFAHPALERSRIHAGLIHSIRDLQGVTLHDLYEAYPDLNVDPDREQELLLRHDIILLQHPFYWYSAPAIIKQWQDLVLEHGWAYGHSGTALQGKLLGNVISTGGMQSAYVRGGHHGYTIREFLLPFEQTARLCNMTYLPPFVIHGTHRMEQPDMPYCCKQYRQMLEGLRDDRYTPGALAEAVYLNELM